MELSLETLTVPKERRYFRILQIFAILIWGAIVLTIVGPIYGLIIALFIWLGNGLLLARLKSNCIRISDEQMPDLYATFKEVCARFNIPVPDLYLLQSEGILNAYAMRHSGRDFVLLNSSLIEDLDFKGDEMRFLMGHELGHIKSKHIRSQIFLFPALWIPLVSSAYYRACESSCDRYGAFAANHIDGAIRALTLLASGRKLLDRVDVNIFSNQVGPRQGFFLAWHELISNYPPLSYRVANIIAIKSGQEAPAHQRHFLAYVFGFFTIHGGGAFATVAIIAFLAAIAIPNFLRAKISANDELAQSVVYAIGNATEAYAQANKGEYPDDISDLTGAESPYLDHNYCGETMSGYQFECVFYKTGYEITATPERIGETGTAPMRITNEAEVEAIGGSEGREGEMKILGQGADPI